MIAKKLTILIHFFTLIKHIYINNPFYMKNEVHKVCSYYFYFSAHLTALIILVF